MARRLAARVHPSSLAELFAVMRADKSGRPPRPPGPFGGWRQLEAIAKNESLARQAPRPIVLGRHLLEKGLKPGPQFKTILDALFERQLDGEFSSLKEAPTLHPQNVRWPGGGGIASEARRVKRAPPPCGSCN